MSKPRISIELEVDTIAHANTIRDAIVSRLVGKDIFEQHSLMSFFDSETSKNMVIAEVRFNGAVDRDDVLNWVKNQVQTHPQVKVWVTRASVVSHLCSHDDEEVNNCRTTEYVEWVR